MQRDLGEILLEQGLITPEQLQFAVQEENKTGRSAWKVLLERGLLSERDLVRGRALQFGLEFVDAREIQPSPEALAIVPGDIARRQLAIPLRVQEGRLVVAMAEPTNHQAVLELEQVSGLAIVPAVAYRTDLQGALERAYKEASVTAEAPAAPAAVAGPATEPPPSTNGYGSIAALSPDDLPLVEMPAAEVAEDETSDEEVDKEPNLADFLFAVLEQEASDLHLTAGLPPMVRVHGGLRSIKGYRTLMPKDLQQIIYGMLTQKQREIFEEHLELDISYSLPGAARFRVNIFQQRDSVGAVMRMIPFEIKHPDELGLPNAVKEFAKLRRGLVLVTGITGSGKSTTLAGLIDMVNSERAEHIMTVEDPIEFLHRHKRSIVNQREVGTDTKGFAIALKHVLRQDPDVILVGEMRDLETISTALTAAETGHLVFATLHTQDAPQSVDRVIDVFPPHQQEQVRIQLAGTIAGIVSQQLVPTAGGKGRVVAAEVLVATPAVRNLIREGKTHQIYTSMQAGGKFGMQVMDQHLAQLAKSGTITHDMGLERCHHMEEYSRLTGKGLGDG
jgi:twitching motility protein PilT